MVVFDSRKYSQPYLRTLGRHPRDALSVRTDFIRLGCVATNRKNGLTGEQLAVGTDSRFVSTEPSRMFSVLTEGCHVGYSREFVGTVNCTYGQSNTTSITGYFRSPPDGTLSPKMPLKKINGARPRGGAMLAVWFMMTSSNGNHKGQWRGALMFSLIYAWINGWVNTRYWRRRCADYDVTLMFAIKISMVIQNVIYI